MAVFLVYPVSQGNSSNYNDNDDEDDDVCNLEPCFRAKLMPCFLLLCLWL